jgi:tRNA 5-methylaminomethyl-2-thiouridine biosynthesis bifunctional protein
VWRPIEAARVDLDATGAPFSERYGDVYASRDGSLGQARHVFLRGNDLPERWRGQDLFVIVETGFGLGVNFCACWQAWREDPARPRRLHVVSIEKHPVDAEALIRFAPPELAPLARTLAATWPLRVSGLHQREFEDGAITLTLALGDVDQILPQLVAGADAFFLDGFAHERNPAMWSPRVLQSLTRLARDGATAATWCTARAVREGLTAAGFAVTLDVGFGHRRHMLRARFAPRWRVRRHEPPARCAGERAAIVVGAGLAGATAAWSLARRGWQVQVLECEGRAAAGASALPWGLLQPQITADDNDASRLVRGGFFAARAMLESVAPDGRGREGLLWRAHGTFVQAHDAAEAARWQELAVAPELPAAFVQFRTAAEAARLLGLRPRNAGWWFPLGASVAAAALCATLLAHRLVALRTGTAIARLRREGMLWIAEDASGTSLAAAPVCIVANALDAPRLLGLDYAPVRAVRGRLSLLEAPALAPLRAATSGAGTLVRADDRAVLVGATYESDMADAHPLDATAQAHAGNLQRLMRLLDAPLEATPAGVFDATRCVARDRLPLVGAVADEAAIFRDRALLRGAHLADLPRHANLYASLAFGSRGLVLAPLAAAWIAAQIEGEPWPLERDLAARIDVARFLLHAVRRART